MNFFFFNDTATTEIYTLSLHDALPIYRRPQGRQHCGRLTRPKSQRRGRSEEHTSELQSRPHIVCRLLLEKKKEIHCFLRSSSDLNLPIDFHRVTIFLAELSVPLVTF